MTVTLRDQQDELRTLDMREPVDQPRCARCEMLMRLLARVVQTPSTSIVLEEARAYLRAGSESQ